jgi:hypothetical protein
VDCYAIFKKGSITILKYHMNALRLFSVVALAVLFSIGADAKCLRVDKNPDCPDAASFSYYQDDNNRKQYMLITRCDGTTCLQPFTESTQPARPVKLPISLPTNWVALMDRSEVNTTPGAELPIYFTDADGIETHFRNPVDSTEEAYYRTLYLTHEQTGLARTLGPAVSKKEYAAQGEWLRAQTPPVIVTRPQRDERAGNAVFGLYLSRHYGPLPTAEEAVAGGHEDLRVMAEIDINQSNLVIREAPIGSNGYLLKVAPIAPEIASEITLSRADGTIIWSGGNTPDAVSIDMSGEPSGMYFVRGLGKSIVVNVVR